MRNNPFSRIYTIALLALAVLAITGCGGGISGTGDGTPVGDELIVVMQPEAGDTNTSTDAVGQPEGNVDGTSSVADSNATSPINALEDLSIFIDSANQIASRANTASAGGLLADYLSTLAIELQQLQINLSEPDLQVTQSTNTNFENTTTVTETGVQSTINWTESGSTNTAISINDARTLHLLQQDERLTVRRLDHTQNIVFQANLIVNSSDNTSVMEALINNNGTQTYLRSLSSGDNKTTFAQHPSDSTAVSQREIQDTEGMQIAFQTCTPANAANNCQSDTDWTATTTSDDANNTFSQANNLIAATLDAIESPANALPDNINSAVIAATEDETSIEANLQCGLQRVETILRVFCVQPLPLQNSVVFQETLSAGEIFYLRTP